MNVRRSDQELRDACTMNSITIEESHTVDDIAMLSFLVSVIDVSSVSSCCRETDAASIEMPVELDADEVATEFSRSFLHCRRVFLARRVLSFPGDRRLNSTDLVQDLHSPAANAG